MDAEGMALFSTRVNAPDGRESKGVRCGMVRETIIEGRSLALFVSRKGKN